MHPADIQSELKKRGITQKALAEEIGVSPNTVSAVINRGEVSARVMKAIAAKIGKHPAQVFEYFLRPRKRKTSKAA